VFRQNGNAAFRIGDKTPGAECGAYFEIIPAGNVAANSNSPMKKHENDFFAEPIDPRIEARALTEEAMCRLLLWMADAPTTEDRGLRASVALYCVRPDLIDGETLEKIGDESGRTKQHVHKLAESFRRRTGFTS
jgi:hypothetical protein